MQLQLAVTSSPPLLVVALCAGAFAAGWNSRGRWAVGPNASPMLSSSSSDLKLNKRVPTVCADLQDSKRCICLLGLLQAVEGKIEQA